MSELLRLDEFLPRVAEKSGFKRDRYTSANIPTDLNEILVIWFWGDWKHQFLFSTVILKNYIKMQNKKYVIFCSYVGFGYLYPQADEFWSFGNGVQNIDSNVFFNVGKSNAALISCENNLLRYFPNAIDGGGVVSQYFDNGFTSKFFEDFPAIQYSLPSVSSPPFEIAKSFSKHVGKKVFIYPCKKVRFIEQGKEYQSLSNDSIWNRLVDNLLNNGYLPVIYQNNMTFDLSKKYANKCQYITETNLSAIIAIMRACDCVLDIFSGISRLALIARVPYLIAEERRKYFLLKDVEIDDTLGCRVPHDVLFFFQDVKNGECDFVDEMLMSKLKNLMEKSNRDTWQSTSQFEEFVPYVSRQNNKSIGAYFITVSKLD